MNEPQSPKQTEKCAALPKDRVVALNSLIDDIQSSLSEPIFKPTKMGWRRFWAENKDYMEDWLDIDCWPWRFPPETTWNDLKNWILKD